MSHDKTAQSHKPQGSTQGFRLDTNNDDDDKDDENVGAFGFWELTLFRRKVVFSLLLTV